MRKFRSTNLLDLAYNFLWLQLEQLLRQNVETDKSKNTIYGNSRKPIDKTQFKYSLNVNLHFQPRILYF